MYTYMIKSCTCICKGRQDKVRHSPKADSEKKNTELPRTGFEPVTTGNMYNVCVTCTCTCEVSHRDKEDKATTPEGNYMYMYTVHVQYMMHLFLKV